MRTEMAEFIYGLQQRICSSVEELDGNSFREDAWVREGGTFEEVGGGRSRVLQEGQVFEKAGVGVSVVKGQLSAEAIASMGGGKNVENPQFFAAGISLVFHPRNPMAPTVHANYRYFERGEEENPDAWWFGGGADLTPAYLFEEDAQHFHRVHKEACDRHNKAYYPKFKAWCDEYFYIPHRLEARGVGGIFFDNLCDRPQQELFSFVRDCGNAFLPAYMPIAERRYQAPFEPEHRQWQQLRRGRYVEFNLVYDRGTAFGLRTGGRTESILMSLPLTARWEYVHQPQVGSEEARLLEVLKHPVDWVKASRLG